MNTNSGVYFSPVAEEFHVEASDGTPMPARRWQVRGSKRGTVIYVHGLGGTAADFDPVGDFLAERGWEGYGLHLRGQGRDPVAGRRGHWLEAAGHLDDLEKFTQDIPDRQGPLFYYGESMGAVIVALAAAEGRVVQADGVILSTPVVALRTPPPGWTGHAILWLARIAPRWRVGLGPLVTRSKKRPLLTRDSAYQNWLDEKPDRIRQYSVGLLANLDRMMETTRRRAADIVLPVLMQHAGQDIFISPVQSAEFFHQIGSQEKKACFYSEAYHLLFRDQDVGQVMEDVATWLTERTSS